MNQKEIGWNKILIVGFSILTFAWGQFYEMTAYLAGVFYAVMLGYHMKYLKRWNYKVMLSDCGLLLIPLGYGLAVLWAIDSGIAFLGMVKVLVPCIFLFLLKQISEESICGLQNSIIYTGCTMTILSVILGITEKTRKFFFKSGRLGGFFQYSNTFALYLLIGIVVLLNKKKVRSKDKIILSILLVGIGLTGSRSVSLLLGVVTLYHIIREKEKRKWIIAEVFVMFLLGTIYAVVSEDYQNIGRYLTLSFNSSTVQGRMLYITDALRVFLKHPMGIGYKGFYLIQKAIQTGKYSVMFVHNDWMQFLLDGGVISFVGALLYFIGHLLDRKLSCMCKEVLIITGIHMLVDFDMEFTVMFCLWILFSMGQREQNNKVNVTKNRIMIEAFVMAFVTILFLWLTLAECFGMWGYIDKSLLVYPWNSEYRVQIMLNASDYKTADREADRILKENSYSYQALNIKAVTALKNGDYEKAVAYKRQALQITRYDIEEYEDYIRMLSYAIEESNQMGKKLKIIEYINKLQEVEKLLDYVRETTSPIAWKLRDQPQLELGNDYEEYVKRTTEFIKDEE